MHHGLSASGRILMVKFVMNAVLASPREIPGPVFTVFGGLVTRKAIGRSAVGSRRKTAKKDSLPACRGPNGLAAELVPHRRPGERTMATGREGRESAWARTTRSAVARSPRDFDGANLGAYPGCK